LDFSEKSEKNDLRHIVAVNEADGVVVHKRIHATYLAECVSDCGYEALGRDCALSLLRDDPLVSEYVLTAIAGVNQLAPEALTISAPLAVKQNWTMNKRFSAVVSQCSENGVRMRLMATELAVTSLTDCLGVLSHVNLSLVNNATKIFIRMVQLLRDIHKLGIIVGNVSLENFGWVGEKQNCKPPISLDTSGYLDSMIILNFNRAEFYPKPNLLPSTQPQAVDYATASPWELEGEPRMPRDDIYRVFETYLDLITGGKIGQFFDSFSEAYHHDSDRGKVMSVLKQKIDLLTTVSNDLRFGSIFASMADSLGGIRKISELVNSFAPFRSFREIVRYNSDDFKTHLEAIREHIRGLRSPDAVPDYALIISEAEKIDKLMNGHD